MRLEWDELQAKLATPKSQFGIIAGGRGDRKGFNPFLEGDDDIIVTVDETKLPGAHDFMVYPAIHTYIMDQKEVQKAIRRFLQNGFFKSETARKPIPKSE